MTFGGGKRTKPLPIHGNVMAEKYGIGLHVPSEIQSRDTVTVSAAVIGCYGFIPVKNEHEDQWLRQSKQTYGFYTYRSSVLFQDFFPYPRFRA
jgi:hypothetical protein